MPPADVAIVGVGYVGYSPLSPHQSYKELMYEAAVRAYADAGVDPRGDIDGFVTVAEDFNEGTSIFDEYVPDQLGAVRKPVHTIGGDGIHGLATAYMNIQTGLMDIVAVEGHSKASNVLTPFDILNYAVEPIYDRPLGLHPYFLAGLEMNRYLFETGTPLEACAQVVVKNKANALLNPAAAYGADLELDDVLLEEPFAAPLTRSQTSFGADGAIVVVLARRSVAESLSDQPIWIRGVGWANGSYAPEYRDWARAEYAREAAQMAYRTAGIRNAPRELDFAEIDDTFAYKELQHMEDLGLCREGDAGRLVLEGATERDGDLPVNVSGGSLGCGYLLEASGLARVLEVVLQLRGECGQRQLEDVETGLAFAWRGLPTSSGAAIILSND
jgi:acetyl-CoA C-acetyltransferase